MENQYIVISRKWHEPSIRIDITDSGIGITITLDDFITALGVEAKVNLHTEAKRVIDGLKQETTRVV